VRPGRIISLKNSNDIIVNQTRDLPVCSIVPSALRHRSPDKEEMVVDNFSNLPVSTDKRTKKMRLRKVLLLLFFGLPVANAPDVPQPCGLLYYP
jgi:hypothetical protein